MTCDEAPQDLVKASVMQRSPGGAADPSASERRRGRRPRWQDISRHARPPHARGTGARAALERLQVVRIIARSNDAADALTTAMCLRAIVTQWARSRAKTTSASRSGRGAPSTRKASAAAPANGQPGDTTDLGLEDSALQHMVSRLPALCTTTEWPREGIAGKSGIVYRCACRLERRHKLRRPRGRCEAHHRAT